MPYYDLRCESCQHEFNQKASIQERSEGLMRCPVCGSGKLASMFKQVNILRFRGRDCDVCPGQAVTRNGGCGCSGACGHG
jgi:putative FmdB family regulatory protein